MSRYKDINGRKKQSQQQNQKYKQREDNWNGNTNIIGDGAFSQNKSNHYKNAKSQLFKVSSEKDLRFQNSDINKPFRNLISEWDSLNVSKDYQIKFKEKLTYFNQSIQESIINFERDTLTQINKEMLSIDNQISKRKEVIGKLKNDMLYLEKIKNISESDSIRKGLIKTLLSIKEYTISIIKHYSKFKKIFIPKNKFNFKTIEYYHGLLEENFIMNLLDELSFISESKLSIIFNFQNNFDILMFTGKNTKPQQGTSFYNGFNIEKENINENVENGENCYLLLNELIVSNFISKGSNVNVKKTKKQNISAKKKTSQKDKIFIEAKNVTNKKEKTKRVDSYSNRIINTNNKDDSSVNEEKKKDNESNIDCSERMMKEREEKIMLNKVNEENNESTIKNEDNNLSLYFYTDNIDDFKNYYTNYYKKIPQIQKNVFHLENELSSLIKGISPMIIFQINNNNNNNNLNDINSLCCISYLEDDPESIYINHFSCLSESYSDIETEIKKNIDYIEKNIQFKTLYIDLYYEIFEDKLTFREEINTMFNNLNFKWVNLVNLESGLRCQKMKIDNSRKNDQEVIISSNYGINISNCLIINCSNKEEPNCDNKINLANKTLCEMLYDKPDNNNNKEYNNLIKAIGDVQVFKGKSNEQLKQFLDKNKISSDIENSDNEVISSILNIKTQLDSSMITNIEGKNYYRISSNIEILSDKDSEQIFYIIKGNNNLDFIFSEINEKFESLISTSSKSIYDIFSIFQNLEHSTNKISSLYIPLISHESNKSSKNLINSSIKNIASINNISSIQSDKVKDIKSFNILPNDNDVVFQKGFFFGIIKEDLDKIINNPILFCEIIN